MAGSNIKKKNTVLIVSFLSHTNFFNNLSKLVYNFLCIKISYWVDQKNNLLKPILLIQFFSYPGYCQHGSNIAGHWTGSPTNFGHLSLVNAFNDYENNRNEATWYVNNQKAWSFLFNM